MIEPLPATHSSLVADFVKLGLQPGMTVLMNSSLSSLGWVCAGAPTVVRALLEVLGPAGTLAVPTFTPENRDPSRWLRHRQPEEWWETIRQEMPAFDPLVTPCREMGIIADTVRTWPGAVRSCHPQTSFSALGSRARALVASHPLTSELGEESPLAAVEANDGQVLLLGVGFERCTAFHLAEYRLPQLGTRPNRCVVSSADGSGRRWVDYEAARLDDSRFAELGAAYAEHLPDEVRVGRVGAADARLFPIRSALAFATSWLEGTGAARSDAARYRG